MEEKTWRAIYELIDDEYFDKLKLKLPKYSLTKCRTEYNVPPFIRLKVKKNIQPFGLNYGLFSQIVESKGEFVVVVQKSSKEKPKIYITEEKDRSSTKNDSTKEKQPDPKLKMTKFQFKGQTAR